MKTMRYLTAALLLMGGVCVVSAQAVYTTDWKSLDKRPVLNPGNVPCDFAWTFKVSEPDK